VITISGKNVSINSKALIDSKLFNGNMNGIFKDNIMNLKVSKLTRINNISKEDAIKFLFLTFLTSYIEATSVMSAEQNVNKANFENKYTYKNKELIDYFNSKNELARVVSSDVDPMSPGICQIYQTTSDDNLQKFDIFFSEIEELYEEKLELGLRLMEKGNEYRKTKVAQDITFETSLKRKIAVYFPKNNDNIPDYRYSYPRAAIHTARCLSKEMFKIEMCSALGLSIGWGALINEINLRK